MRFRQIDLVYESQRNPLHMLVTALRRIGVLHRIYGGFPAIHYTRTGIAEDMVRTLPLATLFNLVVYKLPLPRLLRLAEPAWSAIGCRDGFSLQNCERPLERPREILFVAVQPRHTRRRFPWPSPC